MHGGSHSKGTLFHNRLKMYNFKDNSQIDKQHTGLGYEGLYKIFHSRSDTL